MPVVSVISEAIGRKIKVEAGPGKKLQNPI
jgi:hypothetical protein